MSLTSTVAPEYARAAIEAGVPIVPVSIGGQEIQLFSTRGNRLELLGRA